MWAIEFECLECGTDFIVQDWSFGDGVTCPHCKTEFGTDYDTDAEDNISGPWLVRTAVSNRPLRNEGG